MSDVGWCHSTPHQEITNIREFNFITLGLEKFQYVRFWNTGSRLSVSRESTVMLVTWGCTALECINTLWKNGLDFLFKFQVVVHVLSVETTRSVMKPMRRRQRSSQSGKLWPRLCGTRRRLMQRILSTVCFTQPSGTRRGNKKQGSRSALDFVFQDEQMNEWRNEQMKKWRDGNLQKFNWKYDPWDFSPTRLNQIQRKQFNKCN